MKYKIKLFKTPASITDRQQQEYFSQLARAVEDLNNILADISKRFSDMGAGGTETSTILSNLRQLGADVRALTSTVVEVQETQAEHSEDITLLEGRVDVLEVEIS